jgi:hypothetical protein
MGNYSWLLEVGGHTLWHSIAICFPRNVIHCFKLFPNSDAAVDNDYPNEVRQQETTGPQKRKFFSSRLFYFC